MHLFILINNASGTEPKKHFLEQLKRDCAEQHWSYEVHTSRWINRTSNVQTILKADNPTIVICGGDGTVNKVMKALWEQQALSKVKLLVYPGGTFNALSKVSGWFEKDPKKVIPALIEAKEQPLDIFEVTREKGKNSITDVMQTGVLFVKDCDFTLHAAQIRKALHQWDLSLGIGSIKKSLPYLEDIHSFAYTHEGGEHEVQALYLANNPYLITNSPIYSTISCEDGLLDHFVAHKADYFQIGQAAAVLLLGMERDLPFLSWKQLEGWSMTVSESIHMNLDGDITTLPKGTTVRVQISAQKARLICIQKSA